MKFTDTEMRTIQAAICELARMPYSQLNTFLGSETCKNIGALAHKLQWMEYCEEHGVEYEDMTAEDFEQAYMELLEA